MIRTAKDLLVYLQRLEAEEGENLSSLSVHILANPDGMGLYDRGVEVQVKEDRLGNRILEFEALS